MDVEWLRDRHPHLVKISSLSLSAFKTVSFSLRVFRAPSPISAILIPHSLNFIQKGTLTFHRKHKWYDNEVIGENTIRKCFAFTKIFNRLGLNDGGQDITFTKSSCFASLFSHFFPPSFSVYLCFRYLCVIHLCVCVCDSIVHVC